jgi:hypothetical protein
MKSLVITENTYFNSRKQLAQLAQADVLACIARAQKSVSALLTTQNFDEDLIRLAKSDLAESLMARRAMELSCLDGYTSIAELDKRQRLLEFSLGLYLFYWLATKVSHPECADVLDEVLNTYLEAK